MTRIRTLDFLPEIFQTPTNSQFLGATLDQLVNPPVTKKIEGFVGSKLGYGINALDYYVTEPTKVRRDYQLEPGVVFTKENESVAKDFISYPGILDALKMQGGITNDNNRLFESQFYSWDSFTNLDMLINYNQYYWLPDGPPSVSVAASTVFKTNDYIVRDLPNVYNIRAIGSGAGTDNPVITLIRGGTYTFSVNQDSQFWIQGEPGVSGYSPTKPNLYTRDIYGVTNNGATSGLVTFNVPFKDAQDEYNYPGNVAVGVVSTKPFSQINGSKLSEIGGGIDDVTSLDGRTVLFYNTGVPSESAYVSNFYGSGNYDYNNGNLVLAKTATITDISALGEITVSDTTDLVVGGTLTFTGTSFGNIQPYNENVSSPISTLSMTIGKKYYIETLGTTDWIQAGVTPNSIINAEINGTQLIIYNVVSGAFSIGQTISGIGVIPDTTITGYDMVASALNGYPTYTVSQSQTVSTTNISVYDLQPGKIFTCAAIPSGLGSVSLYNPVIYYIKTINSTTNKITISQSLDGPTFTPPSAASGTMTAAINQGLFEEGFSVPVNDYLFLITFVGDIDDPVLQLTPASLIPSLTKITPLYGTQYIGLGFFKNTSGAIEQIPYISAPLDILYYQDGSNANKLGIIKIIESNELNTLNVDTEILGKKNYTSINGIEFTNGLKVTFDGDVIPTSYLTGEYYVEGVGTGIQLIPTQSLVCPEDYTTSSSNPYDILAYDIGPYDAALFIPTTADYITIARNSLNLNAWSRSNRWFHIQVIQATAEYLNNPNILTEFGNTTNKAKRPIIEFYPNLQLFNSGTVAKTAVDFIDTKTTDAFNQVAGQSAYYPDINTYTTYTGTINPNPSVNTGGLIEARQYEITSLGTTTSDTWQLLGAVSVVDGDFVPGVEYIITDLGTATDWNEIAGTTGITYLIGDIFTAANTGTIVGAGSGSALVTRFVSTITGSLNCDKIVHNNPYTITNLGNTNWADLGATVAQPGTFIPGTEYVIKSLGSVTQIQWNKIAGYITNAGSFVPGTIYQIATIGTTDYTLIGAPSNTVGVNFRATGPGTGTGTAYGGNTYNVGDFFTCLNPGTPGPLGGSAVTKNFTSNATALLPAVGSGTVYQGTGVALGLTVTSLEIPVNAVTGTLIAGMYINDLINNQISQLPTNTRILEIEEVDGVYDITVVWTTPALLAGTVGNASFVASEKNNSDLIAFPGARVVFAADTNPLVKDKIYVVNFANTTSYSYPVITLTEAVDGQILENDQFVVLRGQNNQGNSFYWNDIEYVLAQQKNDVNQAPLFNVYDENNISFGNQEVYKSSTFLGSKLFSYDIPEVGVNDSVLGFPISFSSINNVGDIKFDVSLNSDTFDYVSGPQQNTPVTGSKVNAGYVHNSTGRTTFTRLLGWQTAIAPSTQYQVFNFKYEANVPPINLEVGETIDYSVICDVAQLDRDTTIWPSLQVYNNNNILVLGTDYTVTNQSNSTTIHLQLDKDVDTAIQVLILSDQISNQAYYTIPINLSNNPFNTDITSVDIGDIRGHYQSMFINNPNASGDMFGSNNMRDLGDVVPYGTRIIQNSASLALPGAFLRKTEHNLFDALLFNSREYVKFKTLLVDTVSKLDFQQRFDASALLDEALDVITSVKNQDMPFFWSDMIPNKASYITNTYQFFNDADTSTYPLSKVYDFTTANYDGVLVYLQTTTQGTTITRQLYKNIDYVISTDSPSLIITKDLINGDKIIIKEYNQTYGSYVPNTPTKLGLYPVTIPSVVLDNSYIEPTYFIVGHDGSYTKLYGTYDAELNLLIDYRDQALLEFETRVYNNLKLSNTLPIQASDIVPGYFRDTSFSYDEWLEMYSPAFLNWTGQNRLDYKTQIYLKPNPYTWNYKNTTNKLDNSLISQGFWRGIYQYYYDTSTPDETPWEMLGYANKPDWWEDRYGPAPWTSDNLILWNDLQDGIDYNNGAPVVLENFKRPGLLEIIPVDDEGNLKAPLDCVIANYNPNKFQRDWTIGDDAPVEFSYRRSSTYPYDLMRLQALMRPADFFNLGVDVDDYKYSEEFNQYLVNNRSHLVPSQIQIYGNGTAKTSYINWIVDYEKQLGVGATENISNLLRDLDVRLVHRLAGFSDKTLLKFFVEKGTPDSRNSSLLIPDESYQVLLYENQPYDRLMYSSVIIQVDTSGYKVLGNSQTTNYFKILKPILNGNTKEIIVQDQVVEVSVDYGTSTDLVPYGTVFYSTQEVAQFLLSYGKYLETQGANFTVQESGIELTWEQMVAEFLYWVQIGWQTGSVITLNPAANTLIIDKESQIVQPLVFQQQNFILNQNLYPIENKDLAILREGTLFSATTLNAGDTIAYGQFSLSNIEHGIVFDNVTLFNDVIYNLITGLKQNRMYVRGTKSAEWNGTLFASGFIYNQDNIQEWKKEYKYTKGSIVKYKNKYWTALTIVQPNTLFNERDWKRTEYDEIQKGLLPNSSTRSYESTLYYDVDKANLEQDADQLSFSLIGFRERPYMSSADLTDITQVNVYKNMIKEKGTRATLNAFKGAQLAQGGIDYNIYENWAILTSQFGGVLNSNFVEFKLNQKNLVSNPTIFGLTNGNDIQGAQQLIPLYSLFNYGRPLTTTNVLPTLSEADYEPNPLFPNAGYVNFNDVKMSSYFYSNLAAAVNKDGLIVPINNFYVRDYVWIADYLAKWQILTPTSIGQVLQARSNLNGTTTIIFKEPHGLSQYDIFAIVNFDGSVNGYYVALQIVNPNQVIINLTLPPSSREITGEGIGLKFNSQRVDQPGDIQNLPLLNNEFVKNRVWVDQNDDGGWAVYQKDINYQYDKEFTRVDSVTFGGSVAYTKLGDYLIGDPGAGKLYRYQYDALTKEYEADQVFTLGTSFGTTIAHEQNIFVVSQSTGTPRVYVLTVNDTVVSDDLAAYQSPFALNFQPNATGLPRIFTPVGCTNLGKGLAISGDKNWIYVSDFDEQTSPTPSRNKIHVFKREQILTTATNFVQGSTYQIVSLGDTDFTLLGAAENKVGITFIKNAQPGTGTGTAYLANYKYLDVIDGPTVTPDKFGYSLATNYYGDTLIVGAPSNDYSPTIANWGRAYVYQRSVQNIETQNEYNPLAATSFELAWTPNSNLTRYPLYVYRNGTLVEPTYYTVTGSNLVYNGVYNTGDIITVSGNEFTLAQTLTTETTPRVGVQFGTSVDTNTFGTEFLVGAPFALSKNNQEGAVYRFTYSGARFGYIDGTSEVNVTAPRKLLINGYSVTIPAGDAASAAAAINNAVITNIQAVANNNKLSISVVNSQLVVANAELTIFAPDEITYSELGLEVLSQTQVITCPHVAGPTQFGTVVKFNENNSFVTSAPVGTRFANTTFDFVDDLNQDNDTIFDNNATQFLESYENAGAVYMFDYLGNYNETLENIGAYTYAQSCNAQDQTFGAQPYYGTALDFNSNKVVVGTPYYKPTEVDGQVIVYVNEAGVQDWSVLRQTNPIVDINAIENTQLFSAETNDTLINLDYIDPLQGKLFGAIRQNIDVISNIDPATYNNSNNTQAGFVWGAEQVGTIWFDTTNIRYINYHQNDNVYNAKYWGTLFPGSDVAVYSWIASSVPPSEYTGSGVPRDINLYTVQTTLNASNTIQPVYYFWVRNSGIVFNKEGKTLADINLANYIANPLQSGISYMAPLAPDTFALYNSQQYINANDTVYHLGFSTSTNDNPAHQEFQLIREDYPSDFLPGVPNVADGIYFPQSLYDKMIDSLCGVNYDTTIGEEDEIVPDPFLPKAVQSGINTRPRQSFFYNRFIALKNYIQYANSVLKLYPITEIRPGASYLNKSDEFYDTTLYWERINWWLPGYDDSTKSVMQVPVYSDLAALSVPTGTIVTVEQNSNGSSEFYRYDNIDNYLGMYVSTDTYLSRQIVTYKNVNYISLKDVPVNTYPTNTDYWQIYVDPVGTWTRIGLQNGTIKFKSELYDYEEGQVGFGGDFFSTSLYDQYPSQETRWIIRALNEQIYTNELLIHRNRSLILLFEYIQTETLENENYLPWLNKTSLVDVSHKIRELKPLQNYISDNQEFLEGYVNEAKPYHVVIKEFLFDYTGTDVYPGTITDFDLPATFNKQINKFVTPELVYSSPSNEYEYLPSANVWLENQYQEWYNNYGVSLVGQENYLITTLNSYLTLSSDFLIVKNASGFPVNGLIKIASVQDPTQYELIAYSSVDRALNILSGLTRGVGGTAIYNHIPGENIYIDLPAVVVLDSGRGYTSPPRVIASIDLNKYPEPRENAVLEAVMSLDGVISINVTNPGSGYAVLPEITIEPAVVSTFTSSSVNSTNNTIELDAPEIQTGDLVRYAVPTAEITGSIVGNILNVTEVVSGTIYANATVVGRNILEGTIITEQLSGNVGGVGIYSLNSYQTFEQGDIVVYNQNIDGLKNNQWYYVHVFEYSPLTILALYTTYADCINDTFRLPIGNTVVSGDQRLELGAKASAISSSYPIRENNITLRYDRTTYDSQVTDWVPGSFYGSFFAGSYNNFINVASSSIDLESTQPPINSVLASNQGLVLPVSQVSNEEAIEWSLFERNILEIVDDELVLTYSSDNDDDVNPSGSTIGFTLGMPVKFTGDVGPDITVGETYYIVEINGLKNFKISETPAGSPISLSDYTVSYLGMKCFTAQVVNKGIVYTQYPGIRSVGSTDTNNVVTIPLTEIGQGGTEGLYTGISLLFTGIEAGNIRVNETYYVTSVLDNQRFTMSTTDDAVRIKVSSINAANQLIIQNTNGINVGDRVAFGNMVEEGITVTDFGNISQSNFYYVREIGINVITISETIGGSEVNLDPVTEANDTYCFLVSQENTVNLTNSTISAGSLMMEVSLPASPGQVDGQLFTFYPTSQQYTNISTFTYSDLLERTIDNISAADDIVAISEASGGTTGMYTNMPFTVATNIGGLVAGTVYYVRGKGTITVDVTYTSSTTDTLMTASTSALYVNMPIVFSGQSLGGVQVGETYYIESIVDATKFKIKETLAGSALQLTTGGGVTMTGSGSPYITVAATKNGPAMSLSNGTGPVQWNQEITVTPTFDVSYILGGYRLVLPTNGIGEGFTIGNKITIPGAVLGGNSPDNDLTITVNTIDAVIPGTFSWSLPAKSNGSITSGICSGTPAGQTENYYLKVRTSNSFYVYYDPLYKLPVSGLNFDYVGYTATTASSTGTSNVINVADSTIFNNNDAVVFTGSDIPNELDLGTVYYIQSKPSSTTITVTNNPGSAALTIANGQTINCTVAKAGSFMLLPEPFYFTQSIVKYNNRVYSCVISNNDDEFIFGKWEEINSGDRRLNALDRVKGYYQPTVNMPGAELSQLFTGLTYPYTTYKGNQFDPAEQFSLDTKLSDQPFYPKHVNMPAVIFDELNYLLPANMPNSSGMVADQEVTDDWYISQLGNKPMQLTDLKKKIVYVMTSASSAHPLLISNNGRVWSANGFFVPYGTDFADIKYFKKKLIASQLSFNAVDHGNGKWVAVGGDIVVSTDGSLWRETYIFENGDTGYIYDIKYVETSYLTGYVAVGTKNNSKLVLYSTDAESWVEVPNADFDYSLGGTTAQQNATLRSITFDDDYIVLVGEQGVVYRAAAIDHWILTYVAADTLNDVQYDQGIFAAVGNDGLLITSTDGSSWSVQITDTTENLNAIIYTQTDQFAEWTIVGDNNTVLQATSLTGSIVWDTTQIFTDPVPPYTVQGAAFEFGYGPEELVPGLVSDQLTMIVNTRPGTNWDATQYAHVGYDSVSIELEPNLDNSYSFDKVVQVPAQVSVYIVNEGAGTRLYPVTDYTIDWVQKLVTLNDNITGTQLLRIDVYEVGNGDQLVKSNTQTDPLTLNGTTGFQEINLDCNYSDRRSNGGGIVQEITSPIDAQAIETDSLTDSITVANIERFDLNGEIYFTGELFGGVELDTPYYVKTINVDTSKITLSDTLIDGVAGPIYSLTDGSGSDMTVIIQKGPGQYWSEPAVFHNGQFLLAGYTNTAIRTKASTNSIVTYETSNLISGQTIRFGLGMFGGIGSLSTYYIKDILNSSEFTISSTQGGPTLSLANGLGRIIFITNDYAVALANNQVTAKVIFSNEYDTDVDYISYSFFNESEPHQYGYTIPETQSFLGDNTTTYYLDNYIGDENSANAIVEINGLRLMPTEYYVNPFINSVIFDNPVSDTDRIAVTTFNDTQRQYLNTQYENSPIKVTAVQTILNTISPMLTETQVDTSDGTYFIADNTDYMVVGQYVMFQSSVDTLVTAGNFEIGKYYQIKTAGNTNWAAAGASLEPAGNFVVGEQYVIDNVGTTNWLSLGAASNTAGVIFTATGTGLYGSNELVSGLEYNIETLGDSAWQSVGATIINLTGGPIFMNIGTEYVITTLGNTTQATWNIVAGTSGEVYNVGDSFTAAVTSGAGSGKVITKTFTANGHVVGTGFASQGSGEAYATNFMATAVGSGTGTAQLISEFGDVKVDGTMYQLSYVNTSTNEFQVANVDDPLDIYPKSAGTGLMNLLVGGQPAIRVITQDAHGFTNATNNNVPVRLDGLTGSVQLNGNTFYIHVIDSTMFDLYSQPYNPNVDAVNYPVTICDSYVSGGFTWSAYNWILSTTNATSCNSYDIDAADVSGLEINTPIIFTENEIALGESTSIPEIIAGTVYYVKTIDLLNNKFTISSTREGSAILLTTTASCNIRVSQWEQNNVDRLWVTVNGMRISSSSLRLYDANEVGILYPMLPGDEIIITSMMPSATPDEETYINIVDKNGVGVVYRANNYSRTWITRPVSEFDTVIHVKDVTNITNQNIQENVITPAKTFGYYVIPLIADKDDLVDVVVYNNTSPREGYIEPDYLQIQTTGLGPSILIQEGYWIEENDVLTITSLEGKIIYISGEYMRLESVDPVNNVCDVARGVNGSSVLTYIPADTEVYSLLSDNRMNQINYDSTWNSIPGVYNTTQGDPLQIAQGSAAEFLRTDVS